MNPLEVVLVIAVLIGLLFWMRGFSRIRRTIRQARNLFDTMRRIRVSLDQGASQTGPRGRDSRTVDVSARRDSERDAAQATVCQVCGDRINEAQMRALRSRSVRCPGSSRVGHECPFYGERMLN